MKENLSQALENIDIIKKSIGEAKSNYNKLCNFIIALGIYHLINYAADTISAMILDLPVLLKYGNTRTYINIFVYLLFFIYFIKIYREERINSSKFYLSFLSIFAGIIFLFPFFKLIITIFSMFTVSDHKIIDFVIKLNSFNQLFNILLLCSFIIICSYILKKKSMIAISAIVLFVYLNITLIFDDVTFLIVHSTTPVYLTLSGIYYNLITSIGYIITAIVLKRGVNKKNEVN